MEADSAASETPPEPDHRAARLRRLPPGDSLAPARLHAPVAEVAHDRGFNRQPAGAAIISLPAEGLGQDHPVGAQPGSGGDVEADFVRQALAHPAGRLNLEEGAGRDRSPPGLERPARRRPHLPVLFALSGQGVAGVAALAAAGITGVEADRCLVVPPCLPGDAGLTALSGYNVLDPARGRAVLGARDREVLHSYSKDAQVAAIHNARRYIGDRIFRVTKPHRILDPAHGPLIAVRLSILTRKSLGGLHTNLDGQVLDAAGEPIPGLYAAGEVAGGGGGGYHGYNALEGTFLGSCIFMGRNAGRHAAK